MSSTQLPNYLLANRKRLELSQADVAFLLGGDDGTKFCRYEHFDRNPNLETALACEVIFGRPLSELFGGLYQKVEADVSSRALELAGRTSGTDARKRELLNSLIK
jgi:transcriptional regulator with XRE-family HTH domain